MQHTRPPDCRCPQYSGGKVPQLPPGKDGGWSRTEVEFTYLFILNYFTILKKDDERWTIIYIYTFMSYNNVVNAEIVCLVKDG